MLGARESLQRALRTVAIMCIKNETKIHHKRAQEGWDWIDSKAQRAQGGWGLLSQSNPTEDLNNPWTNPILKRRTGRETQGRRPGRNRGVHEQITKAAINLTQVKGYLYSRDRSDRSDRLVRPVRPVPGTGQTGWPAAPPIHDLIRRPRFFLRNEVFSAMPPS